MFKRFISNAAILITAVLLSFSFISCGSKLDTGEVVFNFSSVFAQSSARNASEDQKADADDVYSAKVILYADEIPQEQSLEWTKDSHQDTMSFTNIPVGSIVYAKAWVYKNSDLQYSGQTNTIVMKAGKNTLVLELKKGDGTEDEEGVKFPIILWNSRTTENSIDFNESGQLDTFELSKSYTQGAQIFKEIKSGMKITKPLFDSPVYCFGNDCIYAVVNSGDIIIEKYIPARSGYVKDEKFSVNVSQLSLDSDDINSMNELQTITSIACTDEYLYLGLGFSDGKNDGLSSVLVAISINNPEKIIVYYNGGFAPNTIIDAMAAGKIDGIPVLCYVRNGRLLKGNPVITAEEGEPERLDLTNIDDGYIAEYFDGISPRPQVGDIQISGNYLYLALYAYTNPMNGPSRVYLEQNGTVVKSNVISNGGIAKFSLVSSTFEPETWKNGELIFGWYRGNYWTKDIYNNWTEHENQTMAPPEELSDRYFYGLRKFVAKKPDELVIVDDGAYVDIENDNKVNKALNKNRIVTFNLKEESVSVVDVDVAFDVTIYNGTGFGVTEFMEP
ncbi:MAG: hypothetical protein IK102_05105 [Treponema sp.]|nr:hypothetical protein [Treponema sp.]